MARSLAQLSKEALVDGLRRGDGAAFDEAYRRHRPRVFGFLVRLCGDRTLAEDLLQETFVRLGRHAGRLAEDTQLNAWLFTVARNLYRSQRRFVLLDSERLRSWKLWRSARQVAESPFDLASAAQLERRLELALAELPLKHREVLLLVGVEQLTPKQAAEVLELSPEATRKRLSRARSLLAKLLEDSPPRAVKADVTP